jgi:hypothetical protein
MSDQTHPSMGELLYEYTPMVTQVVEYGASFEAIASRQVPPPAEGARVDVYFEGPVTGAKLSGSVRGVDYLKLRADGRFELDIYAEITTEDGKKIALAADGVALGKAPDPDLGLRDGRPREGGNPGQGLRGLNMVAKAARASIRRVPAMPPIERVAKSSTRPASSASRAAAE